MDVAVVDVEIDVVDGDEAGEVAPQAAGGKHHPRLVRRSRSGGAIGRADHWPAVGQPLSFSLRKASSPGMVARYL